MPEIIQAVEELDWALPTPIQQEAIPLILGGGDLLAAAETGSGKTGAFAIPMIQITHETLRELSTPKGQAIKGPVSMNYDDRDAGFAISDDGLLCQSRSDSWQGARANTAVASGKYCYEVTVTDEGLCRIGWATKTYLSVPRDYFEDDLSNVDTPYFPSRTAGRLDVGTDRYGFGYGGTGRKSNNKQFDIYGEEFKLGDTIGAYIDLSIFIIGFTKNGRDLGTAFHIPDGLHGAAFYPACVLKNGELKFNFGSTPLIYPMSSYTPLATADIVDLVSGVSTLQPKKGRNPLSLILEPSRELAEQTYNAMVKYSKYLPSNPKLSHGLLLGGVSVAQQLQVLKQGADIVTGTPGRLIDEADNLVQNNKEIILKLYSRFSKAKLQVLMFSATLHSEEIRDIADKLTRFPTWVDLKGKDAVPESVHHMFAYVDPQKDISWGDIGDLRIETDGVHKRDHVGPRQSTPESYSQHLKLLKATKLMKIIDTNKIDLAMIFVRTKLDADNLEEFFKASGSNRGALESEYSCAVLHGDRHPQERKENLRKFKEGEARFLICTDVAARGIDIKELPCMINYTLPDKAEDYIHRVGRVGRADRMGLAISLVATLPEKEVTEIGGDCKIEGGISSYGQVKGGSKAPVYQVHVLQLKDQVNELGRLEDIAQRTFWGIKTKWIK